MTGTASSAEIAPEASRVVGADVTRGRWVAVVLVDRGLERVLVASSLAEMATEVGPVEVMGLDIPIGLPVSAGAWPRPADEAARELVGPRRSSVFRAPPRSVLDSESYDEANRRHRELTGQGLSRQSWALRAKIIETEDFRAGRGQRVIEVHPEVSFAAMNGGPLAMAKKSWDGQASRFRLLVAAGVVVPGLLGGAAGAVPPDDVLDAAAAAWTARRFALGRARRLPEGDRGPGAIWY